MKLEVTRDVVSDLWSLCQAGSASPDSRALVKAYLVEDGSFAAMLKRSKTMSSSLPDFHLSPDAERRLLDDARDRARTKLLARFTEAGGQKEGNAHLMALVVPGPQR
jgi:hypothetical protein